MNANEIVKAKDTELQEARQSADAIMADYEQLKGLLFAAHRRCASACYLANKGDYEGLTHKYQMWQMIREIITKAGLLEELKRVEEAEEK